MRLKIADIAYHLPGTVVTNEDLAREHPGWDVERVAARAGVLSRRFAAPGETAYDLGLAACRTLFARHPELPGALDGILFCTQTPDYVMPPNSCLLHKELGLEDEVFATDFNLACSGYVYGLALARGLLASGTCKSILFVTADTYSRLIHPLDRAAITLFGDAAAASWLVASDDEGGLLDVECGTYGKDYDKFMIPAGGCRVPRGPHTAEPEADRNGNVRTAEHIQMNGLAVLNFVKLKIPGHVTGFLARNGMTMASVDQVVFHQASGVALDALERALRIPPERTFRNLARVGNTVSASIPMALQQAREAGRVKAGGLVLLTGFGVGISYGSALVRM